MRDKINAINAAADSDTSPHRSIDSGFIGNAEMEEEGEKSF